MTDDNHGGESPTTEDGDRCLRCLDDVSDELFQELAVARHSADLAHELTIGIDADEGAEEMAGDVADASDELLELLERRAATVLLTYVFRGGEGVEPA